MELERLNEIDFVDLHVGPDFCEMFRESPGGMSRRVTLPEAYVSLVPVVREHCEALHDAVGGPEFSLVVGTVRYRVTTTRNARRVPVFVLRKSSASLRRFPELGLPQHIVRVLMDPQLTGLVVVVGPQGSGKSSTAASIIKERLSRFGGMGQTIEQPIEVELEGLHGQDGRVTQEEISHEDEYAEALVRSMRITSKAVLMGELRHPAAALQALLVGISGKLVVTTSHADSAEDGIERTMALASAAAANSRIDPSSLIASGLKIVIHQRLVPTSDAEGSPMRLMTRCLWLGDPALRSAIQAKIREGRIAALNQEIDQQMKASTWAPKLKA